MVLLKTLVLFRVLKTKVRISLDFSFSWFCSAMLDAPSPTPVAGFSDGQSRRLLLAPPPAAPGPAPPCVASCARCHAACRPGLPHPTAMRPPAHRRRVASCIPSPLRYLPRPSSVAAPNCAGPPPHRLIRCRPLPLPAWLSLLPL